MEYSLQMVCGRPVHVLPYIGALLTPPTTGEAATKKALKRIRRNTAYSKTARLRRVVQGGILGQYLGS